MAGAEYTQTYSVVTVGGGAPALNCVSLLPGAPTGTYIIKNISFYSTSGFAASGTTFTLKVKSSASSGAGSNLRDLNNYSNTSAISANVITQTNTGTNSIVLTQPYIGFIPNMTAAGTAFLVLSFVFIPTASAASSTFVNTYPVIVASTTTTLLTSAASNPLIIKSILILNNSSPITAFSGNLTFTVSGGSAVIFSNVSIPIVNTYVYSSPLYLNNGDAISFVNASAQSVNCLISYSTV